MQKKNKNDKNEKKVKHYKNTNHEETNSIDLNNEIIIGIKPLPEQKRKINEKHKSKSKKNAKDNKKIKESLKETSLKDNTIYDEIIVDVNIKNEKVTKNKKDNKNDKNKLKNSKQQNIKRGKNQKPSKVKKNKKTLKEKNKKKLAKKTLFIFKFLCLILIVAGGISFCLLSPVFNIKKVIVFGNNKILSEEIIERSEIEIDNNIFRIQPNKIIQSIKQNPYVDDVKIKRKLPDMVNIDIIEREPTYIFKIADAYVYINNQGYILEISTVEISKPLITGFTTRQESICLGMRLDIEDLEKLNDVIHIFNAAKNNGINNINSIDVSEENNYILRIDSEQKEIYLGDASNLTTKMLFIKTILEDSINVPGTIFVNRDLSNKGAFFNEKI